jgi:hypothetical protein
MSSTGGQTTMMRPVGGMTGDWAETGDAGGSEYESELEARLAVSLIVRHVEGVARLARDTEGRCFPPR